MGEGSRPKNRITCPFRGYYMLEIRKLWPLEADPASGECDQTDAEPGSVNTITENEQWTCSTKVLAIARAGAAQSVWSRGAFPSCRHRRLLTGRVCEGILRDFRGPGRFPGTDTTSTIARSWPRTAMRHSASIFEMHSDNSTRQSACGSWKP